MKHATIRDMVEDDVRAVMKIEIRSFPDPWSPLAFVSDLRYNEDARYRVFVTESGRIVGYLGWWNMPDYVSVLKLAVDPAYRRQGIAARLMKEALKSCSKQGFDLVQLHVRVSNLPAVSFYQGLGFQVADTLDGYYADGEDALMMYRPIDF